MNTTFTMFFTVECSLKLLSFGCRVNTNNIFANELFLIVNLRCEIDWMTFLKCCLFYLAMLVYWLARNISSKKVKQLNCFTFWFNERKCYSFCWKLKCHPIKNEKHKWLEITNADWLYFRHFETFAFLRFAICDLRFVRCQQKLCESPFNSLFV